MGSSQGVVVVDDDNAAVLSQVYIDLYRIVIPLPCQANSSQGISGASCDSPRWAMIKGLLDFITDSR